MLEFSRLFIYFFIYSFLGWVCEVAYCSILQKKLVNRGFLHIPICPIYGLGGIAVILILGPLSNYPVLVLVLGFFISSAVEYVVSFALEKLFNMRWWDYSKYRFNLHGRVCLLNSLMFSGLVMVLTYLVHPQVIILVDYLNNNSIYALFGGLALVLLIDTVFTTFKLIDFVGYVRKLVDKIEVSYKKRFDAFQKRFPNMRFRSRTNSNKLFVRVKEYFTNLFENKDK